MLQLRFILCRKCCIYALFLSRISRLRVFWGGIFGRNLVEILKNTQNFGRNSEEKIGLWSLCIILKIGPHFEKKNKWSELHVGQLWAQCLLLLLVLPIASPLVAIHVEAVQVEVC